MTDQAQEEPPRRSGADEAADAGDGLPTLSRGNDRQRSQHPQQRPRRRLQQPQKKAAIDKMTPAEVLSMTRLYFILGLAFLPWLWLVNFIHVWPCTRRRNDLDPSVRTCSMFWTIVIVVWLSIYFTQRNSWGAFGDLISIVLPYGR